jgi:hypothetical protein
MPRPDAFYFADGSYAENLEQLYQRIRGLETRLLLKHLTGGKNDFALWVRHVVRDEELASRLERCKTPSQTLAAIDDHLAAKRPRPVAVNPPLVQPTRALAEPRFYEREEVREFMLGLVAGILLSIIGYALLRALI